MVSAWQSLHSATLELVRSAPIKQRLIAAYRRYLSLIREDQLPAEARGSFAQMMRNLAGVEPLRGEDAVSASVRKMSIQEADDCAALVVELLGMVSRGLEAGGAQRQPAAVVQLRSVECAPAEFESGALIAAN
ncbi:MAG TPA: hypothetical protein VHY75_13180 [Steroidobacteraceae bacterium]|jgi:hypothetical protein|nr:hypothetical protein [Steroidobacteraceae bacterium]